jgi:hypothetical protein
LINNAFIAFAPDEKKLARVLQSPTQAVALPVQTL